MTVEFAINEQADRIDALLPQTQCTRCGFAACRPYAEAITSGDAEINRCPPGGVDGIRKLAALLKKNFLPLDPGVGVEKTLAVAVVDESRCIGCTLCINACPVDAIVGAAKHTHTVLTTHCTGCELCIAPCPVDCIQMVELTTKWTDDHAAAARSRFMSRQMRLATSPGISPPQQAPLAREPSVGTEVQIADTDRKQAILDAALRRAREKRNERGTTPSRIE